MKNSVLQFTRQCIEDNKEYIKGNVAEHLILTAEITSYHQYLSDEESEEYDNNSERKIKLENEVNTFLVKNFDFDIKEFEY